MNKDRLLRIVLLALVILICRGPMKAVDFGFKLGLHHVNMSFSEQQLNSEFGSRSESIMGVFVEFDVFKNFSIQPEFYFTTKGSKYTEAVGGGDFYHFSFEIPGFEVPLLMKYNVPVKGKVFPSLYFGPYAGFRKKATFYRIVDHGETEQFGEREDIKDSVKSADYGLVFGGSVEYKVCFGRLIFDIRYHLGLADILNSGNDLSLLFVDHGIFYAKPDLAELFARNESMKNRALTVMVGLGF